MLTPGEVNLLRLAIEKGDPNIITEWFMRTSHSGTVYKATDSRPYWRDRYMAIYNPWVKLGQPKHFGYIENQWVKLVPEDYQKYRKMVMPVYEARPDGSFFEHHGYRFSDWQKSFYTATQLAIICIGGRGSGKTTAAIMTVLVLAVLYPAFYALCPAPTAKQAADVFEKFKMQVQGTIFEETFKVRFVTSPNHAIYLTTVDVNTGKEYESLIKFFTGSDPSTFKNFEVDYIYVEQAETFDNIVDGTDNVFATLTACLRGYVPSVGRDRIAKSLWIANASHNFGIYKLRDRALDEGDKYLAVQVSTYDNPYLSESAVSMFESGAGETDAQRRFLLFGDQPIGEGEVFPKESIAKCFDGVLDSKWELGKSHNILGYEKRLVKKSSMEHYWKMPYDPAGSYIVSADPGSDNPPNRNAAGVCVFRVDGFPLAPAQMYGFHWVYGNRDPRSWVNAYLEFVHEYKAIGNCAFDATGWQRGYEHMSEQLLLVNSRLVNFNMGSKQTMLNVLKMLMARGMLQMPGLQGLISQLMNYIIPEPTNLRQDLIAMLMVSASQLDPIYQAHVWDTTPMGMKVSVDEHVIFSPEYENYSFMEDDRWDRF